MLVNGDSLQELKKLPENSVDSIVTDPPYGLSFMNKKWDYDVPNTELWKEAYRVLKPGGHLLAFFGSRTYHRGAVRIEDAGFEIRDQIMWVYGSGFPKSHNIGKAYDKKMGNEREKIGEYKEGNRETSAVLTNKTSGFSSGDVTKGTSEWEGWGTALKPAHEPIVMARKPLSENTVVDNVIKHGTGGINIDESRVSHNEDFSDVKDLKHMTLKCSNHKEGGNAEAVRKLQEQGRFPANFIHDGIQEEWSRYFYCPKVSKKERGEGNSHPTVKPKALMSYLIKLVTPKGGTVLDPFMGSGSTGTAAKENGFKFIGIELDAEYTEIARRRINNVKDGY